MRLSNSDLELSRTRPAQTKLDLFVFQPKVVMQCLVNEPGIDKGERVVNYDTVSTGSYLGVEDGMTLLIGTTAGASDVGRLRIRSASATQFVLSENDDINWSDNLHLTVLRYFEIWPVFPRIIQNPNNETKVIFYKDFNIPYSNQNFVLGTFVNAGSHRPVLLENGTGTVYYSSTGTFNLLGKSLTYQWAFEGGTPTGSTSANPGNVYYTTPGDYVTRLTVTAANGAVDTTYRYVSVKNKIGEGSNTPIVRWTMNQLSGSRGEAGYSGEFTLYDVTHIEENAVVMLLADDWYGGTHVSLGGNYPNAEKIFFVGYVDAGSIKYNYRESSVTFTATSVTGIMKKTTGFSISVESKSNPNKWFELRDMDLRRAMYHFLRWHSTVLKTTDFNWVGQDYKIQFFDADRTSLFDAIDNLIRGTLIGSISADRQGRLWAEVDPQAYPDPTGTFTPVMEITRRDWRDEPTIDDVINDELSYIEVGGIAYSGATTGTFGAFLSGAPGLTPSFTGNVEQTTGLALAGQSQLNQLSGNLWANKNQEYPNISMEMSNPARNLDIAPQEVVRIRIDPSDTVKNVLIDKIYIPESITWSYDSENMVLLPSIEYHGVVTGIPGDTITIPADVTDDSEFEFPGFNFPKFPPFALPILSIIDPTTIKDVVILVKDYGVFYTNDFDSDSPTWQESNIALPQTDLEAIEVSMTGRMFCHINNVVGSDAFGNWLGSIYSAQEPGAPWGLVFDATMVGNPEAGAFPRGYTIMGMGIDRWADDVLLILGGLVVTIASQFLIYPFYGNSGGVSITNSVHLDITSANQRLARLTLGLLGWIFTYHDSSDKPSSAKLSTNGSSMSDIVTHSGGASNSKVHTRSVKTLDTAILKKDTPSITTTDGISWIGVSGTAVPYFEAGDRFESIIANDDGQQIVVGISNAKGLRYSNNFGATWITGSFTGTVTAVWHFGEDVYGICGNNSVYSIQGLNTATEIITDKTGNLANIITGAFSVMAMRHYQSQQQLQ